MSELRIEDVLTLQRENSPENRRAAGEKIGRLLAKGQLTPMQVGIAEEVVSHLATDADVRVRAALARHIAHYPRLPASLAETLAVDVTEVSVPVLQHCTCLSDDLLLRAIHEQVEEKQVAIARRPQVSERVSDALIDTGNANVVSALLENHGAAISAPSLKRVLDDHADHTHIPVLVAQRPDLDADVCEHCCALVVADRLEGAVAEQMRTYLVQQKNLPEQFADEIIVQAREQALVTMTLNEHVSDERLTAFTALLHRSGRLSPTLLLRALCSGDMRFAATSLAALAKVPRDDVMTVLESGNGDRFKSLYGKTPLPASLRPAFIAAIRAIADSRDRNGGRLEPARYVPAVVTAIVSCYGTVAPADIESVLSELTRELKREAKGEDRLAARFR